MGKLPHYTNKKKPVIMKASEGPRDMTFEEVLHESRCMIEKMVKKYYYFTQLDPMIGEDDLRNNIEFGLFKAYEAYQYDYEGSTTGVWFLKFAEIYMKGSFKLLSQKLEGKRHVPKDAIVYYESLSEPDENVDEGFVIKGNSTEMDLFDYIKSEFPPKRIDLYVEMCSEVMRHGSMNSKTIMNKFNMPRQTVEYQWGRFTELMREKNKKTHIFF